MTTITNAPKPSAAARFRRAFFTGLLVLAPLWLTGYILLIVVRLLGGMLSPLVQRVLETSLQLDPESAAVKFISDLTAFVATVLFIALIGVIVNRVVGKRLFKVLDLMLSRVPVVREIYDAVRKFIQVFFGDKSSFRGVVAVRYPSDQSYVIGFVTSESSLVNGERMLHVFVPLAPAPTQGILFILAESSTIRLNMTVDEAIKMIVSGGAITPERFAV